MARELQIEAISSCDVGMENVQNTQGVRGGESARLWFRSERLFSVDGAWYFHTREGLDVGPYNSHFDAAIDADLLIQELRQAPLEGALGIIRAHMLNVRSGAAALNTAAFTDYLVETGGAELLRG